MSTLRHAPSPPSSKHLSNIHCHKSNTAYIGRLIVAAVASQHQGGGRGWVLNKRLRERPLIARYFALFLALVSLCCIATPPAQAQDLKLGGSSGTSGVGFYSEGKWGQVSVLVENRSDKPQHCRVVFWFNPQANVQYIREVWIPAKSQRRVQIPVRVLEGYHSVQNSIDTTTILLPPGNIDSPEYGRAPSLLRVESGQVVSAGNFDTSITEVSTDAAVAGRVSVVDSPRFAYLQPNEMPFFPGGYEALDSLVLDNLSAPIDSAQIESVRAWLLAGGRVWVMYDKGDDQLLKRLLKEDWRVTTVDDVPLNDVKISPADDKSRNFEDPVRFRRILAPGMKVLQTVDGWPAALSQTVGRGELLLTTIDPRALISEPKVGVPNPVALNALKDISTVVFKPAAVSPVSDSSLESFQKSLIGYSIIGRTPIIIILGAFVIVIIVAGLILRANNKQEYLAAIGAVMAIAIAILLVGMGAINRGKVPLVVVSSQFARIVPEQNSAVINGMVSVYSPSEGYGPIIADNGGVIWPNLDAQKGELLRMNWSDMNKWAWDNLKLPAGATRDSRLTQYVKLPQTPQVLISFNETGATGKLSGFPGTTPANVLIATPQGRAIAKTAQDTFTLTPQSVLKPGQFTFDAIDQDLERRIGIYERMFTTKGYPSQPVLLAWTQGPLLGIRLKQDSEIKDVALVEVPLRFEPVPLGTKVSIPSLFTPLEEDRSRVGAGLVGIYNPATRTWAGKLTNPQDFGGKFVLPSQVLPYTPDTLNLKLTIAAPGRPVKVMVIEKGKAREIETKTSPVGTWTIDLLKAGVTPGPDGSVAFKVSVQDNPTLSLDATPPQWEATAIELETTGTVGK